MPTHEIGGTVHDKRAINGAEFMAAAREVARVLLERDGLQTTEPAILAMMKMAHWSSGVWESQLRRLRNQLGAFRLGSAMVWKEESSRLGEEAFRLRGLCTAKQEELDTLRIQISKAEEDLGVIRAERDRVASGKTICADCNSILARF